MNTILRASTTIVAIATIGSFSPDVCRASGFDDLLQRRTQVHDSTFFLYHHPENQVSLAIHINKGGAEFQRKGFFHIGVLPVMALDGVSFEFQNASWAPAAIMELQRSIGATRNKRVELRDVQFSLGQNRIVAQRVICGPQEWQLSGNVCLASGEQRFQADHATLQVSGGDSGRLVLNSAIPIKANFFSKTSVIEP